MFAETIGFTTAFVAGLLSFFSPCILPLVPAYFTFITGYSVDELVSEGHAGVRKKVVLSTLSYVSGFSFVFVLMGASASFVGGLLSQNARAICIVGGMVIILFGVHLTGVIRLPGLEVERRVHCRRKPLHLVGTFLVGMAFAAGWSPCIGPILGSILMVAGTTGTVGQGMGLLAVYSLGLAIPFLMVSVFINCLIVFVKKTVRVLKYVNMVSGLLLISVGLLLVSGKLNVLAELFY